MTPLPGPLGGTELVAWRLDKAAYATTWNSGEGAWRAGGRWNSRGRRVIYAALDPATAILEVAVHTGFAVLDTVPHVLTSMTIPQPLAVQVVYPDTVPNPNWLVPGLPSAGQQAWGDALVSTHGVVALPSVVSKHSWIVVCAASSESRIYGLRSQEGFGLDTRLHPPHS